MAKDWTSIPVVQGILLARLSPTKVSSEPGAVATGPRLNSTDTVASALHNNPYE